MRGGETKEIVSVEKGDLRSDIPWVSYMVYPSYIQIHVDIAPCDAVATWTLASHVTELLRDTKPRVYWIQFV